MKFSFSEWQSVDYKMKNCTLVQTWEREGRVHSRRIKCSLQRSPCEHISCLEPCVGAALSALSRGLLHVTRDSWHRHVSNGDVKHRHGDLAGAGSNHWSTIATLCHESPTLSQGTGQLDTMGIKCLWNRKWDSPDIFKFPRKLFFFWILKL